MLSLLSLTRSLIDLAEASEWEGFGEKLAERDEMLARVFDSFDPEAAGEQEREQLAKLRRLNTKLAGLAKKYQGALGSELKTFKQGSKAKKAYSAAVKSR